MAENKVNSSHIRQELIELLQKEDDRISSDFPPQGFGLMEIARSMDNYWLRASTIYSSDSLDINTLITNMKFGINKAIRFALLDVSNYATIFLTPTNQEMSIWADTIIQSYGKLGLCENFLELHRVGLCELNKIGETYRFNINVDNPGIEMLEKSHFDWMVKKAIKSQKKLYTRKSKERNKISQQMDRMVRPAGGHFMTYSTNSRIDEYYLEIGKSESARMFGRDSFPDHVKFGGIEFGLYCQAVEIMVGWALKHCHFISLLLDKRPKMNFRNLCTLLDIKMRVAEYLQSALQTDASTCIQIIDAMTLTQENVSYHCAIPGNFVAPSYIDVGGNKLLSPIWGNLSHPFIFLLNELKRKYEHDWFDNVNHREKMFREDIYSFFNGERFYKCMESLIIKVDGKVLTDIDALIYDRITGKIAVFQLKFQDYFGYSLKQRSNRKLDMLKANKWVEAITNWILTQSEHDLAIKLGIPRPLNKSNFRLFVIGRNAANFSGSEIPNKRVAWGIFLQIQHLRQDFLNTSDPIENLYLSIIKDSPFQKESPTILTETLEIGSKRIMVGKF